MDNNNQNKKSFFKSEYIKIFINISYWIVWPVVVSLIIGKYLDSKLHTEPWILGLSLALSFTVSMVAIVKISQRYLKEDTKNDTIKETNGKHE